MITKALVSQVMALVAAETGVHGADCFLHLRAGAPSTSPPVVYADANVIPTADITGEAGASWAVPNWNGGTEFVATNSVLTFTPVAGHAPLTAVGWVVTDALGAGNVLAWGDFPAPITLLGDDSAIVCSFKLVMNATKTDFEVVVID